MAGCLARQLLGVATAHRVESSPSMQRDTGPASICFMHKSYSPTTQSEHCRPVTASRDAGPTPPAQVCHELPMWR
jgi:hypothetical protein